ncbi:MAG: hypothetical protein J6C65_00040 [Prevotella sp.]|nr:hypothetical protein [Prevotella sp.]
MKENKQKSKSYVKPQMTVIKMEPTCILAGSVNAEAQSVNGGTWSDWEEDEVISSSGN